MRYSDLRPLDMTDTPELATTIYFSGCTHKCPGCHNESIQSFSSGTPFTSDAKQQFLEYAQNPHVKIIAILGGEPFQQDLETMFDLLSDIHNLVKKPIWVWSGYTYEEILEDSKLSKLLPLIDILVDGRFILEQRDLTLNYRGSRNQRIIDVQRSLKSSAASPILATTYYEKGEVNHLDKLIQFIKSELFIDSVQAQELLQSYQVQKILEEVKSSSPMLSPTLDTVTSALLEIAKG